jgi:hypothetical protein
LLVASGTGFGGADLAAGAVGICAFAGPDVALVAAGSVGVRDAVGPLGAVGVWAA